jgi:hypothetical protein
LDIVPEISNRRANGPSPQNQYNSLQYFIQPAVAIVIPGSPFPNVMPTADGKLCATRTANGMNSVSTPNRSSTITPAGMNSPNWSPAVRRVVVTLIFAVLAAGLMLAAGWLKPSVAVGAATKDLWEGVILTLATVGLLAPLLALRLPTEDGSSSRTSR